MKKRNYRWIAAVLTLAMLLPMAVVPATATSKEETEIFKIDFSEYSELEAGTILTRENGFSNDISSSTRVSKDGDNTFLTVDFASGRDASETIYYLNNSKYEIVEAGTKDALSTDAASYGLISGNDPNLDKNLQLIHPGVSYVDQKTVIFEAKYFFTLGAKGSVCAQLRNCKNNGADKAFLEFFTVNSATGELRHQGKVLTQEYTVNVGEWNTISVVMDLETGRADYYVNYVLAVEDHNLGVTNVEVLENSFIVAKIPRTRNINLKASEELNGSFSVDDARLYVPGENTRVTVSGIDASGNPLLSVNLLKNGVKFANYTEEKYFLSTDGVTVAPVYDTFLDGSYDGILTSLGAGIRIGEKNGIRFVSAVSRTLYDALVAEVERGAYDSVSMGTLIAPAAYVAEAGALAFEALDRLDHAVSYLDIPASFGDWYVSDEIGEDEDRYVFAGSIVDIDPSHYEDAFVGTGYVRLVRLDGRVEYAYSAWDTNGVSLHEEAKRLIASGEELDEETMAAVEDMILAEIANVGGRVQDIYLAKDVLFFSIDGSIGASLSYAGDGAWRFKAHDAGYIGFTGMGAAQALAYYMNETPDETVLPIEVTPSGEDTLVLSAEDGTSISLGIGQSFSLRVFNKSGKEVSCLTNVTGNNNTIVLTGSLANGEGVFGGGEKLDSVNRRGMLTRLYSTDGWNNSGSTYMPIPLFFTSRGGGFFFNRYEDMLADFGKAKKSEWTLTLRHDMMDCYLYATEEGKEVIKHYTKITGAAAVPDEWAYGVMVCRYSSDLTTYDTDQNKNNNDGAPSGRSVKTLVSKLIDAGMTPTAVIMEAWNYQKVSTSDTSRRELQKTINWLDTYGIKAMLYMRMGSSVSSSMTGYKEEYFVHANITKNGETTYTMQIPDITAGSESGNPDAPSGQSHIYLDITNPKAVDWYCNTIWGQLVDMGIDGVKIDFCETMPDDGYSYGGVIINYDWYDPSIIAKGGEHHSYPVYFISTFFNKMNERKAKNGEEEGFFVLSRGGGIGSQRTPFLWAGDQTRQFDKLDDQIMAVVTSGLSGVPFMSFDMAGYRYGSVKYAAENSWIYESEMMARAVEFTAFMVNIQTHGTVRNIYELSDGAQEIYRIYTQMHEELYPYINKLVKEACTTGIPAVRHPVLEFQGDANVYGIKDQFMLGDALMVAPIIQQNASQRSVYLPEGSWTNLLTGEEVKGGKTYTVDANVGQVPLFLNNESKDAFALRVLFDSETWEKVVEWDAPLDSTAK